MIQKFLVEIVIDEGITDEKIEGIITDYFEEEEDGRFERLKVTERTRRR